MQTKAVCKCISLRSTRECRSFPSHRAQFGLLLFVSRLLHCGPIMQRTLLFLATIVILTVPCLPAASVYDYELNTIDYQRVHLRDFKGKVLMIVNVASYCGYTPQYAGLQQLYLAYREKGFVMIGVPSNDFGEGEPGSPSPKTLDGKPNITNTFPMVSQVL